MKLSIRTIILIGMIFLFLIILVLSIFSGFYLNKLSNKTSAILKENYLSIVYARDMTEGIMNITQEITGCFLMNKKTDSLLIENELNLVNKSLQLEKNNITEPAEDTLVSGIEKGYLKYRDSVIKYITSSLSTSRIFLLQKESGSLRQQLELLSQMNGKAIEAKTDDAKVTANNALKQMTILGTVCFLIALSFIFSFTIYVNERFF